MKKIILLLLSVFAAFACTKDSDNEPVEAATILLRTVYSPTGVPISVAPMQSVEIYVGEDATSPSQTTVTDNDGLAVVYFPWDYYYKDTDVITVRFVQKLGEGETTVKVPKNFAGTLYLICTAQIFP